MFFPLRNLFIFFITGTVMLLVSCTDAIRRPSGASQMNNGFAHKGIVNGCANCHDSGKPFGSFPGASHPNRNGQDCSACHSIQSWKQGTFSHTPTPTQCTTCHGAGGANDVFPKQVINKMSHSDDWLPECATCHGANAGVKWSGAVFDHGLNPPTCSECHTAQRPSGPVGNPPFDHATNAGTSDCISCHANDPTTVGVTWTGGQFDHDPDPATCTSCHSTDSVYTSIKSTTVNQMNHTFSGMPDCASCHSAGAKTSTWNSWIVESVSNGNRTSRASLGVFHSGVSSAPSSCRTCHITEKPTGSQGTVGLTANLTPTGGLFDHSTIGTSDCVSCHTTSTGANVGITWAGGIYPHNPTPTTCLGCHTPAQRPTGLVGSPPFDHSTTGGTGDCVGCHASVPANVGKVWSLGTFSHSPVPSTCSNCHSSDTDYTNIQSTIKNQMNHSFPGLSDCASCHKTTAVSKNFSASLGTANGWYLESLTAATNPTLAAKGPYHAGVSGTPASCNACHSVDMPVGPVGTSPTFDHKSVDLSTTDCLGCHGNGAGLTWVGAAAGHTSAQTSCFSCHGPSNATTAALMNAAAGYQMAHSYAAINSGTPDCYSCHGQANTFTSWAFANRIANTTNPPVLTSKGAFHASLSAQPVSCNLCHTPELPTKTVPNTVDGFNHATKYGTECASCHKNLPNNVGISWKAPFFNHLNNSASALGTCSPCHDTKKHHAGELCTSCHKNPTYPVAAPATTKGWSGGSFGDGGN